MYSAKYQNGNFGYIIIIFVLPNLATMNPKHISSHMKPLEFLKKGLTKLRDQIQERKGRLEGELRAGRPISEDDQDWLDGDGNLVNEEQVVETLDSASDYEQGYDKLSPQNKEIVQKLQKLAGCKGQSVLSKKRKCTASNFHVSQWHSTEQCCFQVQTQLAIIIVFLPQARNLTLFMHLRHFPA